MDFEDSRFALFPEPNAYIQKFEKHDKSEPKKVVFQEPYENIPNFYINNNFRKGDCDCVSKNHSKEYCCNQDARHTNNRDCDCNHDKNCKKNKNDENCSCGNFSKQNSFGFDIKSLLSLLGLFNKGGGADLAQIVGLLNNGTNNLSATNSSNAMGIMSTLLSNKDLVSNIIGMFKGGGLNLFGKKQATKKEIKTTDFEIKNYTRVE